MISKLKQKLDKLVAKKIEEYYVKVDPHQFEKLDKAVRDENAELWAKVQKLEKENQVLKQVINELRQQADLELEKELASQEQYLKEIMKQKSYRIYFNTKPIRVISIVTNKPFKDRLVGEEYPYLRGLEFVDTPKGVMVNFLLSKYPKKQIGKKDVIGKLSVGYIQSLLSMIYDLDNIVTNLKRGVIQLNMDEYGRPIHVDYEGKIRVMVPEHILDLMEEDYDDRPESGGESEEEFEQDAGDRPKVSGKSRKQRNSDADNESSRANR